MPGGGRRDHHGRLDARGRAVRGSTRRGRRGRGLADRPERRKRGVRRQARGAGHRERHDLSTGVLPPLQGRQRRDQARQPGVTARVAHAGAARSIGRALRLRCPVCGRGRLQRTWFALAERCAACGFSFERGEREDYWLGAYLLNFIVTEVVFAAIVLVVLLATWPEPAWSMLIWLGVVQ